MLASGIPCTAHVSNHLALLYLLARCDGDGQTVCIQCFHPAAVVQLDMIPVAAAPRVSSVGNSHSTVCRREDGRALWGRDVCSAVIAHLSCERVLPVTKRRGDRETLR